MVDSVSPEVFSSRVIGSTEYWIPWCPLTHAWNSSRFVSTRGIIYGRSAEDERLCGYMIRATANPISFHEGATNAGSHWESYGTIWSSGGVMWGKEMPWTVKAIRVGESSGRRTVGNMSGWHIVNCRAHIEFFLAVHFSAKGLNASLCFISSVN